MCKCQFPDGMEAKFGGVIPISPCSFELTGTYKNVTVEILTCTKCGNVSIGWYPQENTVRIPSVRED